VSGVTRPVDSQPYEAKPDVSQFITSTMGICRGSDGDTRLPYR
jgi:hypothetical protein